MDSIAFPSASATWLQSLTDTLRNTHVSRQELANILGISTRNLHRRLSGQTPFTLKEYYQLSQRFQLAPLGAENQLRLTITGDATHSPTFDVDAYLDRLQGAAAALTLPNLELRVTTTDLPVFYLLADPDLCHLKLLSFVTRQQSGTLNLTEAQLSSCAALSAHYRGLTRTEIWGPAPLRSFFHQIERLVDERAVTADVVERGLVAIKQLASDLYHNLNDQEEPLRLRVNPEHATATTYCLLAGGHPVTAWLAYHNPDFLQSADTGANTFFLKHFEARWTESQDVSDTSRARQRFFTDLQTGIARRSERVLRKLSKGEGKTSEITQ